MNSRISIEQLEELMASKEGEQLELKEARRSFHFETLVKYCAALANGGGGKGRLWSNGRAAEKGCRFSSFQSTGTNESGAH